jgi:hypothetical protein
VCHHDKRRGERKKESIAYDHGGLEWDCSCLLQQQAGRSGCGCSHGGCDMLAEKKRESSAQLKNLLVRSPIGASKADY